jgi:hypothetical protein
LVGLFLAKTLRTFFFVLVSTVILPQLTCCACEGKKKHHKQSDFPEAKKRQLHIMSGDGRGVERGGYSDDGGARRAIWNEDGRWCLTALVDDEGGGRSMTAGAFYVGNDGRLRGGADTTIK